MWARDASERHQCQRLAAFAAVPEGILRAAWAIRAKQASKSKQALKVAVDASPRVRSKAFSAMAAAERWLGIWVAQNDVLPGNDDDDERELP